MRNQTKQIKSNLSSELNVSRKAIVKFCAGPRG